MRINAKNLIDDAPRLATDCQAIASGSAYLGRIRCGM